MQAHTSLAAGSPYTFMHGGDVGFHPHQRPFSAFSSPGATKDHFLTRLDNESDPCHLQQPSTESAITTTLSIGSDNSHHHHAAAVPGSRDMDGDPNPYAPAGCWAWAPQIASPVDIPRDGGAAAAAASAGAKRKRPPRGVTAARNDLGSSLGLGQGSSPIDIRAAHAQGGSCATGGGGSGNYSAAVGTFCFDIDSPTTLSLGQMDPISESPDSQSSLFGSSVRSRLSDGFLSIGSPLQGAEVPLYSHHQQQPDGHQSVESRDPGATMHCHSGAHLQLGQRGASLVEAACRGGRSFEGTRRGGLSRGLVRTDELAAAPFALELGPMGVPAQSRDVHNLSTMRTSRSNSDLLLELGLNENVADTRDIDKSTIGPVDEGSSSARWSKAGGFMPSLLMANPHLGGPQFDQQQQHGKTPELAASGGGYGAEANPLEHDLSRMEQDLSSSLRASASCATSGSGGSASAAAAAAAASEKISKMCKFKGCGKGARGASGLCIAHGGGRRCEKQGCNKGAEGRTVYCKAHGGGRRCQKLGCTKSAEGKTDYCIGHGGGRRCSSEGCSKAARGRSGLCIRHGGGKRCQTPGCTKSAEGYSGLCISHGGGRRCQFPACTKGAQGSTMFCKAHGGGKRCMIAGCNKGAEGSTPLCKGHGGGKRCMYEGGGICTKSVHGGTAFCVAHGGGKRCAVEGCSKSARGRTDNCVRHGGGKRCKFEGCGKSAQGSTDFCKAHGGGKRCQWGAEGSPWFAYATHGITWAGGVTKPTPCERFARGKTGLCATHSALVQDTRVHAGSVIGPGLSPGLFRGLVSGSSSGQARADASGSTSALTTSAHEGASVSRDSETRDLNESSKEAGSSDDDDDNDDMQGIESGRAGGWMSSGSGGASESVLESGLTVGGPSHNHVVRSGFVLSHGLMNGGAGAVPPSAAPMASPPLPQQQFQGSLLPPQVLVPPSMQQLGPANASRSYGSKFTEVLTSRTPEDGAFNMSSLSLPEGRVHGGGLMQMLARDLRLGNQIMEGTGLQLSTSNYTTYPNTHLSAFQATGSGTAEGGQSNSPGVDVGHFLATE